MQLDNRKTQALLAVIDSGSFEQAAQQLHLTPSAVSQRVRALETELGMPLVVRSRPCRTTHAGRFLVQYLRRQCALEEEFSQSFLDLRNAPLRLGLAVNNDTLATWLLPALADFVQQQRLLLDIRVDDQDHTHAQMEAGLVLGCISSSSRAMRGCTALPLGIMRYRLVASPAFQRQYFPDGLQREAARYAPVMVFDRKDRLQADFLLRELGLPDEAYPCHYLPSSDAFIGAIRLGFGYGMVPEQQLADDIARQRLVDLAPHRPSDVPLFWHHWTVQSPRFEELSQCIADHAAKVLLPMSAV